MDENKYIFDKQNKCSKVSTVLLGRESQVKYLFRTICTLVERIAPTPFTSRRLDLRLNWLNLYLSAFLCHFDKCKVVLSTLCDARDMTRLAIDFVTLNTFLTFEVNF